MQQGEVAVQLRTDGLQVSFHQPGGSTQYRLKEYLVPNITASGNFTGECCDVLGHIITKTAVNTFYLRGKHRKKYEKANPKQITPVLLL